MVKHENNKIFSEVKIRLDAEKLLSKSDLLKVSSAAGTSV